MPQRKSAFSLKKLCLSTVAKDMDYWCSDYIENFTGQNLLYVVGPFDCLHNDMLLELFVILKDEKLLRRPYFDLLLRPGIDRLNLSCNPPDLSYVLKLIGRVCANLRCLDLSFCDKLSSTAFRELAKSINQIVSLNLRCTGCTDNILSILGAHCPNLKELDVSWCPVSDDGITSLCINLDDLSSETPARHSKIHSLSVVGTNVTEEGAMCAIKNLPYLTSLYFTNTCLALELLHRQDLEEGRLSSLQPYWLTYLNSDCDARHFVSKDSVQIAVTLCPRVKKISAANTNITKEALLLLSNFKHLQELELGNGSECTIKFDECLVPLLSSCGSELTTLSLAEIPGVDVTLIGSCCPELETLCLLFTEGYTHLDCDRDIKTSVRVDRPFQKLKSLRVVCTESSDIPHNQLRELLSHCIDVESIYIQRCQSLSDSVVTDVVNSNLMPKLKLLELEYCNVITAASIMTLMSLDNTLEELKMWWCKSITRRDFDVFKDIALKENLNLKVEWM